MARLAPSFGLLSVQRLYPTAQRLIERATASSEFAPAFLNLPQLRVETVANPVAEDVQREHGNEDRDAGQDRNPPRLLDQPAAVGDHHAPRRRRRREPDAQER